MNDQKLKNRDVRRLLMENEASRKYMKSSNTLNWIGTGMGVAGMALSFSFNNKVSQDAVDGGQRADLGTGIAALSLLGSGLALSIMSSIKSAKALKAYNAQYQSNTNAKPSLEMACNANGLGIRLHF